MKSIGGRLGRQDKAKGGGEVGGCPLEDPVL